jgi:predicted acyltransferase
MGKKKSRMLFKILRRALMLLFLGVLYNGLLNFDFENLRYASVLGRIGLAWAVAALIYLFGGKKVSIAVSVILLLGYWALLALVKAPDALPEIDIYSMEGSIVGYIDRLFLPGALHLGIHDPEGLLSTLPAVVTAMAGIFTGEFVRDNKVKEYRKVGIMLCASFLLLVIGYLWGMVFPINKNLWTSSFTLFAAGWSLLLFAMFYLVIDVVGLKGWSFFFRVIGMNSITIYLLQQFFDFHKPVQTVFGGFISLFPEQYYPSLYWCCYLLVCWLLLYFLYRKGVFLKV